MRSATLEDMPQLVRLAELFCHELGEACNAESIEASAQSMIESDSAVLLIGPNSVAGAVIAQHFFDLSRSMATELFWYVTPDARGSGEGTLILEALEDWAKDRGASRLSMIAMASLSESVGRMYESRGYKPLEATWVKEL